MDAIQAARELGKAIQADARYIRMNTAQQKNDEDADLQKMIAEFNSLRTTLNDELKKEEKDNEKIQAMDKDLRERYQTIFANENMDEFTKARTDVEQMITFINQIITGATQGLDPDTIEYQESCGGDCGGCSGCS